MRTSHPTIVRTKNWANLAKIGAARAGDKNQHLQFGRGGGLFILIQQPKPIAQFSTWSGSDTAMGVLGSISVYSNPLEEMHNSMMIPN